MSKLTTNRKPLLLVGVGTIEHLNIRKEGPDDERTVAADVKLLVKGVSGDFLLFFDLALPPVLWDLTSLMFPVRNPMMQAVRFAHELEGCEAVIGGQRFLGATAKKFSLQPVDGGLLDVTLSVTVYPRLHAVEDLARMVQESVDVQVDGPPDLFHEEGPAGSTGGPTAASPAGAAGVAP